MTEITWRRLLIVMVVLVLPVMLFSACEASISSRPSSEYTARPVQGQPGCFQITKILNDADATEVALGVFCRERDPQ